MNRILTTTERERLKNWHRHERDGKKRDRIKAVLAYDDGYNYCEIAKILLLDDKTIGRHIEDYLKEKKLILASGGSDGKLSMEEAKELREHLQEVTYLYVKDIRAYVRCRFNKRYSISGMTKWLYMQGFRYKKPHAIPAKANQEQQQAFIKYYNELKANAGTKEPIYFADSVHPQHQTQLAYGWILKGERKEIATTGRQYRVNIMGGICLNGHRFVYQQADKIDAYSIAGFLVKLRNMHTEKSVIHVIWDNAGYHNDKEIKAFAERLAIKLESRCKPLKKEG